MNKDDALSLAEDAADNDPAINQYGMHVGTGHGIQSTWIFLWFPSLQALTEHLLMAEPLIHDLSKKELTACRARLRPLLKDVQGDEIPRALLQRIQDSVGGGFQIDWIGSFTELCEGSTPFASGIRQEFRDVAFDVEHADSGTQNIAPQEREEFVGFIRSQAI